MPAMPDMGPAHDEVEVHFTGCNLNGDIINAQAEDHEMVLTFAGCTLTGAISTGKAAHTQGKPEESKWWLIGLVDDTLEPVEKDKGTKAEFDAASKWIVDKTCYLSGLTIAEGAKVEAAEGHTLTMTVDGKETAIVPGTYAGKIVMTVA